MANSIIQSKQCQIPKNLCSWTLTIALILITINAQPDFHYANEQPNGQIRQFVDSTDVIPTAESNQVKDTLPDCSQIPRLLCCTSRVIAKCYDGCAQHVQVKCPHKLRQLDRFETGNHFVDHDISQSPLPPALESDADLLHRNSNLPTSTQSTTTTLASTSQPITNQKPIVDVDIDLQSTSGGGFIEPLIENTGNNGAVRITDTTKDVKQFAPDSESTDNKCGTKDSTPPFLPCYSRQVADSLFAKCCRESVPHECRSMCTYEHREEVAARTMVAAVQDRQCDLKWLSSILMCANQNRDNRECCRHLKLASPELGVGDRCLRMCNVDEQNGGSVGTVDQRDLVCLSNWNVIMYCARAGIRSLARLH